ncbi:hypothetical protein K493DRAFT_97422 [Basidiobolus meristosporus CBS 931.73]|uniref:Uncharacterized protein n=1 Tax=Basidiobolus meristosporus CBS 931.73 TaxID=1314790 RepID=A0A1Y1X488_9FUNG|nr:hypothetical protein K493DRAFT_97422 [Basidiobolus meristosporus CBS 931.73]|eukprot:ORX80603.1 hypothetical protein K493DRAFT_97422 [Basidiobolus meristosporus CBS 931.73]
MNRRHDLPKPCGLGAKHSLPLVSSTAYQIDVGSTGLVGPMVRNGLTLMADEASKGVMFTTRSDATTGISFGRLVQSCLDLIRTPVRTQRQPHPRPIRGLCVSSQSVRDVLEMVRAVAQPRMGDSNGREHSTSLLRGTQLAAPRSARVNQLTCPPR